jgi:putative ABC transport system permease protein
MNWVRMRTVLAVNIRLCLLEIFANRTRSFITSLGIFLGVASLLVNLSFVRAMDDDVQANMKRIGGLDVITVKAIEPVTREEKMAAQRSPGLSVKEVESITHEFPSIQSVLCYRSLGWERFAAGGKHSGGLPVATDHLGFDVYNYEVGEGRMFSPQELQRGAFVCLIGERLAKRLFNKPRDALGKTVTFASLPFRVIGLIHTDNAYNRRGMECLIPYTVYRDRLGGLNATVDEIPIKLISASAADVIQRGLTRRLQGLHRGVLDFEVEINRDKINEMQAASYGMKILLWSIAMISLIVGAISIMNIMFATIGDRIREIGIRKALGAQRIDVFTQFIIEAVLVCLVGGIPGMLIGAGITLMPSGVFPFTPRLDVMDYGIAVGFTVCAGFFSGLFPAIKAANMQPVEALQY